ncbi:hypothetical protein HT051_05365 [Methyloligella sp. GL2]|nr:hypothetical protein HT051_05365 [Methyloligella sp. GL2]
MAMRELTLIDGERATRIPITIHLPQQADDGAWSCRYEIGWPEVHRTFEALGADAIQSLVIALQMIGAELYTSTAHKEQKLKWEEAGSGYGFPVARALHDILEGDDAKFF